MLVRSKSRVDYKPVGDGKFEKRVFPPTNIEGFAFTDEKGRVTRYEIGPEPVEVPDDVGVAMIAQRRVEQAFPADDFGDVTEMEEKQVSRRGRKRK